MLFYYADSASILWRHNEKEKGFHFIKTYFMSKNPYVSTFPNFIDMFDMFLNWEHYYKHRYGFQNKTKQNLLC